MRRLTEDDARRKARVRTGSVAGTLWPSPMAASRRLMVETRAGLRSSGGSATSATYPATTAGAAGRAVYSQLFAEGGEVPPVGPVGPQAADRQPPAIGRDNAWNPALSTGRVQSCSVKPPVPLGTSDEKKPYHHDKANYRPEEKPESANPRLVHITILVEPATSPLVSGRL